MNEPKKTNEVINNIEYGTKAQLRMNERGDIICKVVGIRLIDDRRFVIVHIHILSDPTSKTAILMDMIARKEECDRLMNLLVVNKFYKIFKIKPYIDHYYYDTMTFAFDKLSYVQILHLSMKIMNRFNINWLKHKREITTNYEMRNLHQVTIAGFVHSFPVKQNSRLFIMRIRNKNKQTINVNLWVRKLPEIFANLKLNDIIILPKVNHSKIWNGVVSINNNGPIYKENNLWVHNENNNNSNLEIINLSAKINEAKCIFFLTMQCFFFYNNKKFVVIIYSNKYETSSKNETDKSNPI